MRKVLTPLRLLVAGLALATITFVLLVVMGSSDYLEIPDQAHPLEQLVRVPSGTPDRDGGGIYYVDVLVKKANMLEALLPSVRPDGSDVVQRQAIVPPGVSERERIAIELNDMKLSQQVASVVALRALGYKVKVRQGGVRVAAITSDSHALGKLRSGDVIIAANGQPVTQRDDLHRIVSALKVGDVVRISVRRESVRREYAIKTTSDGGSPERTIIGVIPQQALDIRLPFPIKFNLGEVGGPSAGLAFALELLEKRGRDVDHGYKVAATGAIELNGHVSPIGGVKQKTIGARQTGVDVFLVPAGDNARDARRYAKGLRIIPVESFQQALQALATLPPKG